MPESQKRWAEARSEFLQYVEIEMPKEFQANQELWNRNSLLLAENIAFYGIFDTLSPEKKDEFFLQATRQLKEILDAVREVTQSPHTRPIEG